MMIDTEGYTAAGAADAKSTATGGVAAPPAGADEVAAGYESDDEGEGIEEVRKQVVQLQPAEITKTRVFPVGAFHVCRMRFGD